MSAHPVGNNMIWRNPGFSHNQGFVEILFSCDSLPLTGWLEGDLLLRERGGHSHNYKKKLTELQNKTGFPMKITSFIYDDGG
jgi:hypothetical protein